MFSLLLLSTHTHLLPENMNVGLATFVQRNLFRKLYRFNWGNTLTRGGWAGRRFFFFNDIHPYRFSRKPPHQGHSGTFLVRKDGHALTLSPFHKS